MSYRLLGIFYCSSQERSELHIIISKSFITVYEAVGNVVENPGRETERGRKRTLDPVWKSPTFRDQWRNQQRKMASGAAGIPGQCVFSH